MTSYHDVAPADYQELRIALVMNGGVSLAVWIGGVSHEINRATRGAGRYGQLLELTATTARVDVISGASAGGINGALLALALAYDADLAQVRNVWLSRGSLERLLHSPYGRAPTSLLRGNDRFFEDLRAAFTAVRGTGPVRPPAEVPLDLTLTTTMLHGVPNRIVDDLGVVIGDVTHRGRFVFRRGETLDKDPFAEPDIAARLALAARASASFPIAFEPVFCPVKEKSKDKRLLDMVGLASFQQSRFLLDGGILDNKPLEAAVRAIVQQRATREVRRVLAYVIPTPGQTSAEMADEIGATPTLGEVALASLIELPRVESVSAQLEEVIEHNRLVRRKRETRIALIRGLGATGMRDLADGLFLVYSKRRLESSGDYIVEVLSAALASDDETPFTLGRRGREWVGRLLIEVADIPWVPRALPVEGDGIDGAALDRWSWGAFTVEHSAEILIDLFRRAVTTVPLSRGDLHLRERLKQHYTAAYDLVAAMPQTRRADRMFWAGRAAGLAAVMTGPPHDVVVPAREWAAASVREWSNLRVRVTVSDRAAHHAIRPPPSGDTFVCQALGWMASTIAALIADTAADVRAAAAAGAAGARTEADKQAADDLRSYIDYLAPEGDGGPNLVLVRLLTLEVVQYATGTYRDVPDQFVELVQISADVPSVLGGPSTAAEKLAGAQLGNFGGFYKAAWRANDWMFGRMDGADRLVRVLLNPARLARLYAGRKDDLLDGLHRIAVPPASNPAMLRFLQQRWDERKEAIETELAFLERNDLPVPEHLPRAVEAIVAGLHLDMAREELPVVVGAAEDDRRKGAGVTGASADLVAAAGRQIGSGGARAWLDLAPEALVGLFGSCRIGEERFADEVRTDLFASTLTQALAVSTTMVSGRGTGLGALGRVLQVVRFPMLIIAALAQNAVTQSRSAAFIAGVAVALGGLIVGLDLFTNVALVSWVVLLGTVLFVGSVALSLRRHPRLVVGWLVLVAVVWALFAVLPEVKQLIRKSLTGIVTQKV